MEGDQSWEVYIGETESERKFRTGTIKGVATIVVRSKHIYQGSKT